ncbi:MAG: hypothetical protein AAF990_28385 [Bacteroidota bacterium]
MRDRIFYSIEEINQAIAEQLTPYNKLLFKGKDYSREDRFSEEQSLLGPLPNERFQWKKTRWMTVMKNCHIRLAEDKHYYSIPYRYIGSKVKMEYTQKQVSVYHNYQRIAFHERNFRHFGYSTAKEHLPSTHQFVSEWSAEKFINWAEGH